MGSLWNRSGMVERYADDLRAAGAQAFFFSGGTTTPMTVFQDSAESSAHPNPVVADANGRWPDVFVPYVVSYDVQVKTADNVQLTFSIRIPNPDPVEQTVVIPPAERIQTGMIHPEFVNAQKAGYVRLNGRTIGNATSLATERANADTQALFIYGWDNLTNAIAPVSGGRGASGAADFAANKTIQFPNMQGAVFVGLDDMGSTAGNKFTGLTFTAGDAVTAGSLIGGNSVALTVANMPAHAHTGSTSTDGFHTHTGSTSTENAAHNHAFSWSGTTGTQDRLHTHLYGSSGLGGATGGGGVIGPGASNQTSGEDSEHAHSYSGSSTTGTENQAHAHSFTTDGAGSHSHTFTTSTVGSGTAFNNLPVSRLVTWFIKL